jgi:LmbE family N-acetylglucosaminyl deacetylase
VILSPHLDDAVFSCWHLLESPRAIRVLNVFAGPPPPGTQLPRWDRITGARDPVTRVLRRIEEDRAALALVGCEPTNLPFVEAQYRKGHPTLDEVLPVIREHVTDGPEVFAPAGIGNHAAHLLIREAALELAGDGLTVSFYAEIPYATEFGWPAWVTDRDPAPFLDVDAAWSEAIDPIVQAGYEPKAVTLDEQAQRRKVEAMETYLTQFAALEAGGQRRLTHPELVRHEVVWIRPAP